MDASVFGILASISASGDRFRGRPHRSWVKQPSPAHTAILEAFPRDKLSGLAPSIEDLGKNGQEKQGTREQKKNEDGNESGDAPEVAPDLAPLLGGPWLPGIPDLHEEAHESLNRKDVGQDEVSVAG